MDATGGQLYQFTDNKLHVTLVHVWDSVNPSKQSGQHESIEAAYDQRSGGAWTADAADVAHVGCDR